MEVAGLFAVLQHITQLWDVITQLPQHDGEYLNIMCMELYSKDLLQIVNTM